MAAAMALFAPALAHAQSIVSTILGGVSDGAPALSATLNIPAGVTADRNGNVYVALKGSHQVVRVDSGGTVWLVAGTGAGGSSGDDGPAKAATLLTPVALAIDSAGNLYIADSQANRVRRVGTDGTIAAFAGNGYAGSSGDGGPATNASLSNPTALAVDGAGDVLIADTGNNTIRMVTPDGLIAKVAGDGTKASSASGSPALTAHLNAPAGVATDSAGNIYIADTGNNWVYRLGPSNTLILYAGSTPSSSSPGFGGGTPDPTIATNATLVSPTSLAVDSTGNLYFVEYGAPRVREVTPAGKISSFAGTGTGGSDGDGGLAQSATLNVLGIAVDFHNNVLIADGVSDRVRIVTAADGVINTLAGNGLGGINAYGIALVGNSLYFSDTATNYIRMLNLSTGQLNVVAGNGQSGFSGDGNPATSANLNNPRGVALDQSGNLYIADMGNNRVRRVGTDGKINTFAGNGQGTTTGDGYLATSASVHQPAAVAVDASGNVFVCEYSGQVVRKVATNGYISTVAGTGSGGAPGAETGIGIDQRLSFPQGLSFDSSGALLIADTNNNRIRRLTADGVITTVAGSSSGGSTGDGSPATSATLRTPMGAFSDTWGNLYIADSGNSKIRRVSPDGVISTVAGTGTSGFIGDGSPATAFQFNSPSAVIAGSGSGCTALVADTQNGRLRQVSPSIDYAFTTNPPGLQVIVDGQTQATPVTVGWLPGTHHQVDEPGVQTGSAGVRYLPTGSQTFDVVCGPGRMSVVMTFATQYLLSVATDHGGTVAPGAGWVDSGTSLTLNAAPNPGYTFGGWEGDCKGTASCTLVMDGPKSIKADFAPAQVLKATIASGGVVGAGLSVPAVAALAPDGIAIAFGTNFAPTGTLSVVSSANLVQGKVSAELDGVCVLVGTTMAPVLALTPTQVNFQVPETVAPGTVQVQVATGCGTVNEVRSQAVAVSVQNAAPEFFYFVQTSSGQNPIAAVDASTGVDVGPAGLLSGATFSPAMPGDVLTLYATGLGLTNPEIVAGELPAAAATIDGTIQVSVGGTILAASDVLYAGVTPSAAGLYQINIHLPASIPSGEQPVLMTVSGFASPKGPYINVQQ
jgi:uncharacterized protein (TIGR03437 family)